MSNSFIEKDHSQIVKEMLIDFANELGVNSISNASDIAVKAKVLATQIEGIYYNQDFILKQSNPKTATGEHLDNWGESLNVGERKQATKAVGKVKMGRKTLAESDIPIPKGSMFSTDPDTYGQLITGVTTKDATLLAGTLEIEIDSKSEIVGDEGCVPAGAFIVLNNPPIGIEYVTNSEPFKDGADIEDDDTYKGRFKKAEFNGTDDAFANRAMDVTGVTYAKTLENNRGPGTTDVLIATDSGIPSNELINQTLQHLLIKRPLLCDLGVIAPIAYLFDSEIKATLKEGFTLDSVIDSITICEKIKQAVRNYLKTIEIGGIIRKMGLSNIVYDLDEVIDVEIITPTDNIQLAENSIPQEGVINVTV